MEVKILEEIGLTKSETNVYLALLELGSSSTGKIVDKSKASSSKIYEILDRLMQKGLVSFIIKSGVKFFEAAPPERIMDFLKEKEKTFSEQKNELKKIIPELELKRNLSKYKSEATVFKGIKGGETAFRYMVNSMTKEDEWIAFVVSFTNKRYFDSISNIHRWRANKGLRARLIINEEKRADAEARGDIPLTEIKFVPGELQTPAIVNVAGNITLINIMGEDATAFMIESKDVADSFRNQFETLWTQKVHAFEGTETAASVTTAMLSELKKGDEYFVLNANWGLGNIPEVVDFFKNLHRERQKKGIKANFLFNTSSGQDVSDFALKPSEYKFLPQDFRSPLQVTFARDKLYMALWSKKSVGFMIENKQIVDAFKAYFDTLWNQDVKVYKGYKEVTEKFTGMLDECSKKNGYYVLGASYGEEEKRHKEWFINYHKERVRKEIPAKLLCIPKYFKSISKEPVIAGDTEMKISDVKSLPEEFSSPMQINLYPPNKVLMFLWGKEFLCFEIESELLYNNFKSYFDTLWSKEVNVDRGLKGVHRAWDKMLDELKPGEEYYVLGGSWHGHKDTVPEYFKRFHEKRIKKGVKAKFLFISGTERLIEKCRNLYKNLGEVKFLPELVYEGLQINLYKNKVMIFVWREKEPVVFTIEDETVFQTFKTYYDTLWNQDTKIVRGLDAVQNLFEEMLVAGSCDFIGARGYFTDARPKYTDNWEKRAIKSRFKMRNIADPEIKGHRITKFPFVQTKYTIPKEFAQLSVFWIFGNKVAIANWTEKEPMVVIIENKAVYDMYKQQFELLWKKDKF